MIRTRKWRSPIYVQLNFLTEQYRRKTKKSLSITKTNWTVIKWRSLLKCWILFIMFVLDELISIDLRKLNSKMVFPVTVKWNASVLLFMWDHCRLHVNYSIWPWIFERIYWYIVDYPAIMKLRKVKKNPVFINLFIAKSFQINFLIVFATHSTERVYSSHIIWRTVLRVNIATYISVCKLCKTRSKMYQP